MSTEHVMRYRYSDNVTEKGIEITLEQYVEVKKTPRGAWVERYFGEGWWRGEKRFVLDGHGRRHCHQSKEQAWESFRIRKQRQHSHAKLSLERAELALEHIEKLGAAPEQTVSLGKPNVFGYYLFE